MIIYFFLFFLILFCAYVNYNTKKINEYKKFSNDNRIYSNNFLEFLIGNYGLVIIAFMVIASIRNVAVGMDNVNYEYYFNNLDKTDNIWFPFERGYVILNWIVFKLNLPYFVVQGIIAILTISCFYIFINKYSKIKWLSWLLFLALGIYAQMLNLNRQIIAVAIILLSIIFLQNKKFIRYFLCVILAFFFHKSALVALVFLPIFFIKLNYKSISLYLVLTIIAGFTFIPITKLISKILGLKYDEYFNLDPGSSNLGLLNLTFTIGMAIVFFIMLLYSKNLKKDENNNSNNFFLSLFLMVVIIRTIGHIVSLNTSISLISYLQRLTPYFFFSLIILIPNYFSSICKKFKKLSPYILVATISGSAIYMYLLYAVKLSCGVVPYFTI